MTWIRTETRYTFNEQTEKAMVQMFVCHKKAGTTERGTEAPDCKIVLSWWTTIEKLWSTFIWQDVPEKRYRVFSDLESNHFAAPKLSECRHRFVLLIGL